MATRLLARLGASAASATAGRPVVAPPLLLRLCVPSALVGLGSGLGLG